MLLLHPPVPFPCSLATVPAAQILYVDDSATGANDGSSWANAFTDLHSALALAGTGDFVFVATGSYLPSSTGDRTASFTCAGAGLYGGFDGTELSLDDRAGLFDRTILSGDLNGDDGPGFANTADNSRHVVTLLGRLDGFTITGGNAENGDGGGLICGILSQVTVENCTFRANQAARDGGAVSLETSDESWFRRCTFVGNRAGRHGGAVHGAAVEFGMFFENCRFLGNTALGGGGAFHGDHYDLFTGCEFAANSADGPASEGGGAILSWWPELLNCTVYGNSALGSPGGGGVRTLGGGFLQNSILWGNLDDSGHGEAAQVATASPGSFHIVLTCCIEGWSGSLDPSPGNLHGDPRFADPDGADGLLGTPDDDFRLLSGSPAVDTASPWTHLPPLPEKDLDGGPRFFDALACGDHGVLDMGAHERSVADGTTGYCPQPPTSLGVPAEISAPCVVDAGTGTVGFRVGPVTSTIGLLFFGLHEASLPYGPGGGIDRLCLGGTLHRLPTMTRTGSSLALQVDLADPRAAPLVAGSTWHFQALFRDAGRLRLTDATTITFRD